MNKAVHAILCDLDGVITQTAQIHARAWKILFDEFLKEYSSIVHKKFSEFNILNDYPNYIDGKPRLEGIRSYLNKLGIKLPENGSDAMGNYTVQLLAERKNVIFNNLLEEGVSVYQESVEQLKKWKEKGIKTAVVSSSKNCKNILKSSGIEYLFDVIVDGIISEQKNLKGKPEPDTFLYAAELLNTNPGDAMVVEDSLAGIIAGKRGNFGLVVGIIHDHDEEALYRSGAHYAVNNLEDIEKEASISLDQIPETESSPWCIIREGFNPNKERIIESIFSFSNGYIGSRNSLEEDYNLSEQSTYLAGIYQLIAGTNRNELAKVPDWTRIQVFIDNSIIDLVNSKNLDHKRYLDLKRGLVVREWRSQDNIGRITNIKIVKFISIDNKHTAYKSITVKPENFSGKITVITGINGKSTNSIILIPEVEEVKIIMKTNDDTKSVTMIQKSIMNHSNVIHKKNYEEKKVYEQWAWMGELGKEYTIESLVTIFSNLENERSITIGDMNSKNIHKVFLDSHVQSWQKHWEKTKITITGDENSQTWINFALYHLISEGEFSGNYTSIGAKGLTGISYQGHIFWDTEMYLLPFYLFTAPEIAKALLMYRYNTLSGARENARREGHKGSCFAWESTDSGLEMTPTEIISPYGRIIPIYSSFYEIHITPDIAYAVWQYWQVTHDDGFLVNYGSEIIIEAVRFCVFFLRKGSDQLYHIKDVVGPDEYHERIDDNVYTNLMAYNNLDIALRLIELLKSKFPIGYEKLKEKINIQVEEIEIWKEIKDKIYTGYNSETKLYEQFKGYFNLEYIDLKSFEPRKVAMDLVLGERIKNTQVIKQADVLMFLFLLANKFSEDVIEKNYNYYEPRTSHGSSLSPSIYCIIAARLGKLNDAYKYFIKNAEIDLNDNFGNATGGVHIASIGGTWMSVVMGFAGMYIYDDGLLFDPHLPEQWEKIELPIHWRGQRVNIQIRKGEIKFEVVGNQTVNISIGYENWRQLTPNNIYSAYKDKNWEWKN